jgi:hypothetical protein
VYVNDAWQDELAGGINNLPGALRREISSHGSHRLPTDAHIGTSHAHACHYDATPDD